MTDIIPLALRVKIAPYLDRLNPNLKFLGCSTDTVLKAMNKNPQRYTEFAKSLLSFRQTSLKPKIAALQKQLTDTAGKESPRNSRLKQALQKAENKQKKYSEYQQKLQGTVPGVVEDNSSQQVPATSSGTTLSLQERNKMLASHKTKSKEEQEMRKSICKYFGVRYSHLPRRYPPISITGADTGHTKRDRMVVFDFGPGFALRARPEYSILLQSLHTYLKTHHEEEYTAKKNVNVGPMERETKEYLISWALEIIAPDLANLSRDGAHGYGHSYADKDIVRVHGAAPNDQVEKISLEGIEALRINGKTVLLQQATRGCTAAVAAMLIADQGGEIDINALQERNLGNDDDISRDIARAGFTVKQTLLHYRRTSRGTMSALKSAIQENGPAIVSVNNGVSGHVVIVDAIDTDSVTLRDPFHGWRVDVKREAFIKSLSTADTALHIAGKNNHP